MLCGADILAAAFVCLQELLALLDSPLNKVGKLKVSSQRIIRPQSCCTLSRWRGHYRCSLS